MLTRIIVAVIFTPAFLALIYFAPPIWTAVLVAAITAVGSYELLRATKTAHHQGMYLCTGAAAVLISLGSYVVREGSRLSPLLPPMLAGMLLMYVLFFSAIGRYGTQKAIPVESILFCLFGGVAIPALLSSLVRLRLMPQGRYLVLLPVICAFLTDVGAYFSGVFLGKHRGITKVSPNKSLEGYIGGVLSGGVFMLAYAVALDRLFHVQLSVPIMALYGLVGSLVTELGDLSFSFIKRQYGIKDYGDLLPGHGGMLDRFDSMIFAAPTLWLMVELLPAF